LLVQRAQDILDYVQVSWGCISHDNWRDTHLALQKSDLLVRGLATCLAALVELDQALLTGFSGQRGKCYLSFCISWVGYSHVLR
jgi:hypothetical protein